jgi:hypothetical protein
VAAELELGGGERPGPNERHVTAKDVPDLRYLVDARTAEPVAKTRDAGVVREFPFTQVAFGLFGMVAEVVLEDAAVGGHGLELEAAEGAAAPADPSIEIKRRTAVNGDEKDARDHDDQDRRRKQHEGTSEVEEALGSRRRFPPAMPRK